MRTSKPRCSRELFYVDFADQLSENGVDTDTVVITTTTWTVENITSVYEETVGTRAYIRLDGGVGSFATAKVDIRVDADDIELCETIYIDVIDT